MGFRSPLQSVTTFLLWGKVPFRRLLFFFVREVGRPLGFRGLVYFCLVGGSFGVTPEFFRRVAASFDQGPACSF